MKEIKKLAKEGDSRRGALTILAKDLVSESEMSIYLCLYDTCADLLVCGPGVL